MDVAPRVSYLPGDPRLVDDIVYELKSQGIFDQFRKECLADVDTKPAYQNLNQRVDGTVNAFLRKQTWKSDLNKNQLRDKLRKHILDSNFLDHGVDRIVDQAVNPKVSSVFIPKVEEVVYRYLGIDMPSKPPSSVNGDHEKPENLLPNDLEAVSPDSTREDNKDDDLDEENQEEDIVSPAYEPIEPKATVPSSSTSGDERAEESKPHERAEEAQNSSDDSDSEINLRIDMSPLTPVRGGYDDENSSDAQPAFDRSASFIGKSFSVENFNISEGPKIPDSDEVSSKSGPISQHRSSVESKESSESINSESNSNSVFEMVKSKMKIAEEPEAKLTEESNRNKKESSAHRHRDRHERKRDSDRHRHSSSHSRHDSRRDRHSSRHGSSRHRDSRKHSHHSSSSSRHHSKSKSERKDSSESKRKHRPTDDHYSSSGKGNRTRRSTDRDSNDGNPGLSGRAPATSQTDSQSNVQKTENNSNTDSSSPNDTSENTSKRPIRLEQQLNTPLTTSEAVGANYIPLIKIRKPKIASNATEALRLMKIRKEISIIERNQQQAAMRLMENHENIPKCASQIFSGLSGPELEFTCSSLEKTKVSSAQKIQITEMEDIPKNEIPENTRKPKPKIRIAETEVSPEKETKVPLQENILEAPKRIIYVEKESRLVTSRKINPKPEPDLLSFTDSEITESQTVAHTVSCNYNKIFKEYEKKLKLPKLFYLINPRKSLETAFVTFISRKSEMRIIRRINGCTNNEKPKKVVVPVLPDREIRIPNETDEEISSPVRYNSSCDLSSPDCIERINEKLNKASRKEIMEIILGGDMELFINNANGENTQQSRKRRLSENEMQNCTSENNNQNKECPVKVHRSNSADMENGNSSPRSESEDFNVSSTDSCLTMAKKNSTGSKFLGKARSVGLSKVKNNNVDNSKSPHSDKSVENYPKEYSGRNGDRRRVTQSKRLKGYVLHKTNGFHQYKHKLPLKQDNA